MSLPRSYDDRMKPTEGDETTVGAFYGSLSVNPTDAKEELIENDHETFTTGLLVHVEHDGSHYVAAIHN